MPRGPTPNVVLAAAAALFLSARSRADDAPAGAPPKADEKPYSLHFQQTVITQAHPAFRAPYSGQNSLHASGETETSITSTLFAGAALWSGAEVYLNPELSGGSGLSSAFGVAGFPNGETFRIGSATPVVYPARAFLRQTLNFGEAAEQVLDGLNQTSAMRSPHRLTLTAGKFGIADIFDNNRYTHDPRTQFMNWALMNSGAWDYPADTRGYTWGLSAEYVRYGWTLRGAAVLVPLEANGSTMDTHLDKAEGFALESQGDYRVQGQPGTFRVLVFLNRARMGDYQQAIHDPTAALDIARTRAYGRTKYGFAMGLQQQLGDSAGVFARLSWNDGRHETWAFAEIDGSAAVGGVVQGAAWARPFDEVGVAALANAISAAHRDYLRSGGYGFMIGDGQLNYGWEGVLETYYKLRVIEALAFSADYQFIVDPAYNRDRGPVHVFALRSHFEY